MKLIRIEWLKLKGNSSFWIITSIYLLVMVGIILAIGSITPFSSSNGDGGLIKFQSFGKMGFYKVPLIWQNLTYVAGFFKIIPTFVLILFITNEFRYRTIRQNVIDGLSIGQFYLSKLITATFFALLYTLVLFILILLLAQAYNPDSAFAEIWKSSEYILAFFLEVWFMMLFGTFLAILFKRGIVAIIVLLLYYFFVEPITGAIIKEPLRSYLPTNPSRGLVTEPFTKLMNIDIIIGIKTTESIPLKKVFLTLAYSLIFAVGGFLILKRRDI